MLLGVPALLLRRSSLGADKAPATRVNPAMSEEKATMMKKKSDARKRLCFGVSVVGGENTGEDWGIGLYMYVCPRRNKNYARYSSLYGEIPSVFFFLKEGKAYRSDMKCQPA